MKHQLLPHAALSNLFLHHDGSWDTCCRSQSPALPPAASRPEEVSAPSALKFYNQFLFLLCKLERNRVEDNPTLPWPTLAVNADKKGGERGRWRREGLRSDCC